MLGMVTRLYRQTGQLQGLPIGDPNVLFVVDKDDLMITHEEFTPRMMMISTDLPPPAAGSRVEPHPSHSS